MTIKPILVCSFVCLRRRCRVRFLFRQRLTHQRMRTFLSVMMKLKKAKNLDPRLEALVDNAFYTCCPPERYVCMVPGVLQQVSSLLWPYRKMLIPGGVCFKARVSLFLLFCFSLCCAVLCCALLYCILYCTVLYCTWYCSCLLYTSPSPRD